MNLDEYRAMKAEEAQQVEVTPSVQTEQSATPTPEQTNQTENQAGSASENGGNETTTSEAPTEIEIDGQKVSIDELKNGYMRQSDYTRKTQELAITRQQTTRAQEMYKKISENPEFAQEVSEKVGMDYLDPTQEQLQELQSAYQDLLLEREVERLSNRYEDFNPQQVLQFAYDHKYENLEDAYLLWKSKSDAPVNNASVDVGSLKEQIRQELLAELQLDQTVYLPHLLQSFAPRCVLSSYL